MRWSNASRRRTLTTSSARPKASSAIVQACLYLATAPKSNAAYMAQKSAWRSAKETGSLMPPMHILNAPTKLMKNVGYGKGYAYDHDADEGFSGQDYWPEEMEPQALLPADRPRLRSAQCRERLEYWERDGAKSCNNRPTTGLTPRQNREQCMYQVDQSAYWQAQMMNWGPRGPHRHPDPGRDLDRRARGPVGVAEGDRPRRRR